MATYDLSRDLEGGSTAAWCLLAALDQDVTNFAGNCDTSALDIQIHVKDNDGIEHVWDFEPVMDRLEQHMEDEINRKAWEIVRHVTSETGERLGDFLSTELQAMLEEYECHG